MMTLTKSRVHGLHRLLATLSLAFAAACDQGTQSVPPADSLPASTAPAPAVGDSAASSVTLAADSALRAAQDSARIADSLRTAIPVSDARVEVDLSARTVTLFRGTQVVTTAPVAIGSSEWPTRTGEWFITQVVWNPEWNPPDESWAEQRTPKAPGAPDNPLGHAQLVYDPPRTIHGTNEPSSIGKAVSHGSIRVTNTIAKKLARQLMEMTGVVRDEAWYAATQKDRTVKQIVDLPQRVPIRVF